MKAPLIAAAALVVAGFGPMASASLVAYDGFHTGSANGTSLTSATDNDASGWSGQWIGGASGSGTLTTGLTYAQASPAAALASGGQAVEFGTNNSSIADFRTIASASQVSASPGNVLWASFLINTGGNTHAALSLMSSSSNYVTDIGTDYVSSSPSTSYYGVDNGTAGGYAWSASSTPETANNTVLLVAEISYTTSTAGSVNFWVNPDITSSSPTGSEITAALTGMGTISQIRLFNSTTGSGSQATFDEIRLGTTYADVVPEPTSLGAFFVAAGVLATRRRRRTFG